MGDVASSEDARLCDRVIGCGFSFDERGFRDYCELFLRAKDKVAAPSMVLYYSAFIFVTALAELVSMHTLLAYGAEGKNFGWVLLAFVLIVLLVVYASQLVTGIKMCFGRKLRWGRRRWKARTSIAFHRMGSGDTENPVCVYVPGMRERADEFPDLFSRRLFVDNLTPPIFDLVGPFEEPLAFDVIPGLLPRFPMLEDVELSVRFSAAFYPDRIEKGSHGVVFARSYADVHDVVEHRRYPGLAILRHENGFSQLVVRTDLLAPGEWDEVKGRIERAKEERLRGLGPVARVRELFK